MRLPKKIVTNKTNDTNIDAYLSILWTINTGTTTALTYDTVLLFDFKNIQTGFEYRNFLSFVSFGFSGNKTSSIHGIILFYYYLFNILYNICICVCIIFFNLLHWLVIGYSRNDIRICS